MDVDQTGGVSPCDVPRGAGTPTEEHRLVIFHLLQHPSDAAAARSMNMSVRTLRRRVAEVSHALGVGSRLALGFTVANLGWFKPGSLLARDSGDD
jgi:hypothetical protein